MKKLTGISGFFLLSFLLAIILAAGIANGQSNTLTAKQTTGTENEPVQNRSRDLLETWMPKDIIPFSFKCDGRSSAELLKKEKDKPGVYSALNGTLQVMYELKEYQQNGCVEWVVRIKNVGSTDSPVVSDLMALDLFIPLRSNGTTSTVYHSSGAGGGDGGGIEAFKYSGTALKQGGSVNLSNPGGGKTVDWLPFFNLDLGDRGIIGALGWAGRWMIRIDRLQSDTIRLQSGMIKLHTVLHPGEEIRTPGILLMAWEGDRNEGHNRFRRHILENHTPRNNGKPVPDLLCFTSWGGMKTENHLKMIEIIRRERLPYDCYWIDAGWYGPPHECEEYQSLLTEDWFFNVGDWRINPMVHPKGLKPVSDAAHAAGMKFLLWFEPERAVSTSPLVTEHPEWFFRRTPGGTAGGRTAQFRMFNFGIPDARRWMTDLISDRIKELGIDIYRHDGNFALAKSWDDEDTPDRIGISEIRYVEGLNEFWDELQRRFPNLILDLAQRRDLETVSRGLDLFRSDYSCSPYGDPTGGQVSLHGISHWIPLSGTSGPVRPGDTYSILSDFSPSLGLPFFSVTSDKKVIPRPPDDYPWDWHRKVMKLHKKASPFFRGDFYPLLQSSTSPEEWCAMQFHRADLDAGMVLFYRRPQSPYTSARFPLHGLSADTDYLIDNDGYLLKTVKGSDLMDKGLQVMAELPRTANIIFYRKAIK